MQVNEWIEKKVPVPSVYLINELFKYLRQFKRLEYHQAIFLTIQDTILHDIMWSQPACNMNFFVGFPNSKNAGQIGIAKTAVLFRRRLYFPNFVNYLTNFIKDCSSCLQIKPRKYSNLKPLVVLLAIDKQFPCDTL